MHLRSHWKCLSLLLVFALVSEETYARTNMSCLAPRSSLESHGRKPPEAEEKEMAPVYLINLVGAADIWDAKEKRRSLEQIMEKLKQRWLENIRQAKRVLEGEAGEESRVFEELEKSIEVLPSSIRWVRGRLYMDLQHRKARRRYKVEITPSEGQFRLEGLLTRLLEAQGSDFRCHTVKESTLDILEDPILPVFDIPKLGTRETPKPQQFDYADSMTFEAAKAVIDVIKKNQARGMKTVMGLFTGNTAHLFCREFVPLFLKENLNPNLIVTFNLDEYAGVSPKSTRSYRYFMEQNLFKHVKIPKENIHFLSSFDEHGRRLTEDAEKQHLRDYEKAIEREGGLDVCLLGIGPNGHIAFNEPGSSFDCVTRKVTLSAATREANKRHFGGRLDKVPHEAMTMGIGTILKARKIFLMANGEKKANAVLSMLRGDITPDVPASVLRNHPKVEVFVDDSAAAGLMPVRTGLEKMYQWGMVAVFAMVWVVFRSPYGTALMAYGIGMYMAFVLLALPGLILIILGLTLLAVHNRHLREANPFFGMKPGEKKQVGNTIYAILPNATGGIAAHVAMKIPQRSMVPNVVFHHGGEFAEGFAGVAHKIRHVAEIDNQATYDVRFNWAPSEGPCSFCNRLVEASRYRMQDDSEEDAPVVVTAPHVDIADFPFRMVEFRDLEAEAKAVHEAIRNGELSRLMGIELSDESCPIGFSFGGRAELVATAYECLEYDDATGEWRLRGDFDPKVRGLVVINSFFMLGEVADAWMKSQKKIAWKPFGFFSRWKKTVYDQMNRDTDMSKLHQRIALASTHPNFPQTVMIATTMEGIPGLLPPPWKDYGLWIRDAANYTERKAALQKVLGDLWGHLKVKIHAMFFRRDEAPFYSWGGSIFKDVTKDDGIVDLNLALGKDHHGNPLFSKLINIKVRKVPHDCMEHPLMQQLSAQFNRLQRLGIDLREQVHIAAVATDGSYQIVHLKDHDPAHPIVLNGDDKVTLHVVHPAALVGRPGIQPLRVPDISQIVDIAA